jgi:hypothetical protein
MAKLQWNVDANKRYHKGVSQVALYVRDPITGQYGEGEAWEGARTVTMKPGGAEVTSLYANNEEYANITSKETLEGSIEAYDYPDSFAACDGSMEVVPGAFISQQERSIFGLAWRTEIANGLTDKAGYIIHVVYGCRAKPSEMAAATINESTEAREMSWDFKATASTVAGFDNAAKIHFDSTKINAAKLLLIEQALFGTELAEPYLPTMEELIEMAQP